MKTEVGSFRLNKDVLSKLKKEAESENLSLNSLVNRVMETHVNWHSHAAKIGIVPISSEVIKELFKNMTDDAIKKLAKNMAPEISEDLLLLRHEDTLDAFLDLSQDYFGVCGFPFSVQEKNGIYRITVRHTLGKKYSLYLEEIVRIKINGYTKKEPDVTSTAHTITLSLNK